MHDETIVIHAGYESEATTKAVAVPIYQTVAYEFDNAQHGADLFNLAAPDNIYTRIMNPTQAVGISISTANATTSTMYHSTDRSSHRWRCPEPVEGLSSRRGLRCGVGWRSRCRSQPQRPLPWEIGRCRCSATTGTPVAPLQGSRAPQVGWMASTMDG